MRPLYFVITILFLAGCSNDDSSGAPVVIPEPVAEVTDVLINSQASLEEAILSHHTHITGNLYIVGPFLKIDGLETIEKIDGSLIVSDCPNLINIDGLIGLESARDIIIQNNRDLESITGLSSLTTVQDIQIINNTLLPSLEGLEGVSQVKNLRIKSNFNLDSFTGLENLNNAQNILLEENFSISDMTGFNNLQTVNTLKIYNGIEKLSGLANLHTINNLIIDTGVLSTQGLGNITGLNQLIIQNNQQLLELKGFENVTSINHISIKRNSSLNELNFDSLASIGTDIHTGGINLENNKLLSLSDFAGVTNFKGSIFIFQNRTTNFCGLQQILQNGQITTFLLERYPGLQTPTREGIIAGVCVVN